MTGETLSASLKTDFYPAQKGKNLSSLERRAGTGETEPRFSAREHFTQAAGDFVAFLEQADSQLAGGVGEGNLRLSFFTEGERRLNVISSNLHSEEATLLRSFWELFTFKHGLTPLSRTIKEVLFSRPRSGKIIEFMAPLGAGKSLIAETLAEDLGGKIVSPEPFRENPFWQRSQENPDFMLRSQLYFLLSNTIAGFKLSGEGGISISDSSRFTDIYMWMEWYYQMSMVNDDEYQLYHRVVNILKPLMLKPDLLVAITPPSAASLREGVVRRAGDQTDRAAELQFKEEDLQQEIDICRRAHQILESEWGIKVLEISIDPVTAFLQPDVRYSRVYEIRKALDMLGGLIKPSSQEVAEEVLTFFGWKHGKLAIIYSPSMFTGKTEALRRMKDIAGEQMVIFRPACSIRSEFEEDESTLITRDGHGVEVISITSNDISRIPAILAEMNITPERVPVIGIDEGMLFLANKQDPRAVVITLRYLMSLGFNIAINGVALTYKGEPFHYMDFLLAWAKADPKNVKAIEMTTRCIFCKKEARVTRLTDGDTGKLADYGGEVIQIGSARFAPVCGEGEHVSCANRPPTLELDLMPKPEDEYQRLLEECGVL